MPGNARETPRKHPGNTRETPGKHPGNTQETPRKGAYKVVQNNANETYTFTCLGSAKTALKFKYEI